MFVAAGTCSWTKCSTYPLSSLLAALPCPPSLSLHFGWVTCAALVNFNSYISLLQFSDKGKLNFSLASIVAAVGLGIAVTGTTGDPIYAGVVAWALTAVASEEGWERMKVNHGVSCCSYLFLWLFQLPLPFLPTVGAAVVPVADVVGVAAALAVMVVSISGVDAFATEARPSLLLPANPVLETTSCRDHGEAYTESGARDSAYKPRDREISSTLKKEDQRSADRRRYNGLGCHGRSRVSRGNSFHTAHYQNHVTPPPTLKMQPTEDVGQTSGMAVPLPASNIPPATTISPLLRPAASLSQGKVEGWTLDTQALAAKIGAAICAATAIATPYIKRP